MFDKILIANRGEIACRVARTARRMGIRTVAVYSDADAGAMHVAACDEAHRLGPPPPRESYLNGDAVIALARATGAQAIHPGYGFLSENADFAAAVAAAGLTFIGPPPEAIRAMGSKSESKLIMGRAHVPLVPGYHGKDQSDALLAREASAIGFPVLIKASAGGGGKGMRVVEREGEFAAALASARREAKSSFGDDTVLLEKYLSAPRHIEMQVFADTLGSCVHLFERDCSVQRRHQKVIEEAPAPGIGPKRRTEMGAAAVAAAKAIGYVGAGTVEFIVDSAGTFYFMEMNTRLQVEHPVTEMITGLDLVEWQLRVAAGEPLPLAQESIGIRGHAIEARIYAEDPERGFLPSVGRIVHMRVPAASSEVRVDTGVKAGDEISEYYDPMLAKLIAHGEDRTEALRRLRRALGEYQVVGVATNVAFLQRVIAHEAFARARFDTGLIARHQEALFPPREPLSNKVLAIAALAEFASLRDAAAARARDSGDPYSPWQAVDTWWLNTDDHAIALTYVAEEVPMPHPVRVRTNRGEITVDLGGRELAASVGPADGALAITLDGECATASVVASGEERHVFSGEAAWRLKLTDPLAHAADELEQSGHLAAPMSGTVVSVLVEPGDAVARGAPLLILEAMKMEHTITAPADGVVSAVHYRKGDKVREGADLIDVAAAPA
ncbi:MAG TPA: acetyl/propionyl/methylcrotonyl-CoA carboxylase subunit alpha [Casimicrobiaceae bacterium]|nr:acetyl/propionyl/methylcrotonyl-CoA carboxylase subunit alpha [Casimicrobiaceae bacterium]